MSIYDKNTLNLLSKSIETALHVYDGKSGRLVSFNGAGEKEAAAPSWIASMAEAKSVRKLFQKDGKAYACYCFDTGDGKYIIFQDNPESEKLGLFIKALSKTEIKEKQLPENEDVSDIKKELIKAKSDQTRLLMEAKQKDALISDLKAKLEATNSADIESMRKTLYELKEVNAAQNSEIRNLKADTDRTNFQKLKQVNKELRDEISGITYKAAEAEERSGKIRKILQNTIAELARLLDATTSIDKNDIKRIVSKISSSDLGDAGLSLTGVKANYSADQAFGALKGHEPDISDIINALNTTIADNNASSIDIDKLASVVPINDKAGIKRSPAMAIKPIIGTLIGMAKTGKLSQVQINMLCDAVGIKA